MRRPLPLLAPLLLLASGCGLVNAQVDVPEICATIADREFPPSDPQTGTLETDVSYDLSDDLKALDDYGTYDLALRRLSLTLGSTSGLTDLGGLESAEVTIEPEAGSTLQAARLVSYTRGADAHPTSITLASPTGLDLEPYVEAGVVTLHTKVSGTLPTSTWRATMTACFQANARVSVK